ncbi:MAG TPA: hypothetical protein VGQ06_12705 [Gemmatimonadales bacterium]|jgi:hypothetical protein|nr:hypothetical protein [Gemmatimonadales bacterium]
MRKVIGGMAAVAVLMSVAAVADAQRRAAPAGGAKHEFGVDAGIAYYDPDGGEAGIRIGTPLDVRVGFVSPNKLQWEGRLLFAFDSKGAGTEGTHFISPGVNGVYTMKGNTNRRGMYLTGGAALNLVDAGAAAGTGFSVNGAVGWRKPYGGAAWRYELGVKYDGEVADGANVLVPKTLSIGARVGISFWH